MTPKPGIYPDVPDAETEERVHQLRHAHQHDREMPDSILEWQLERIRERFDE